MRFESITQVSAKRLLQSARAFWCAGCPYMLVHRSPAGLPGLEAGWGAHIWTTRAADDLVCPRGHHCRAKSCLVAPAAWYAHIHQHLQGLDMDNFRGSAGKMQENSTFSMRRLFLYRGRARRCISGVGICSDICSPGHVPCLGSCILKEHQRWPASRKASHDNIHPDMF